jgi:hypothetical protein
MNEISELDKAVESAKSLTIAFDLGLLADVIADIEKVIIPRGGRTEGSLEVEPAPMGLLLSLTFYFPVEALREYSAQQSQQVGGIAK